ncbi:FIG017861: hypothetical protein [hydrothermal vent metagenome]|uniref:DNA gyrase subunit B n=1 Tax=hydrothermal vent metagenome TaxID=652676 RepID=A0A3B0X1Y2_9ZZZZ
MRRILIVLVSVILLLYPIAVYYGLQYFEPRLLGLLLLGILLVRFSLLIKSVKINQLKPLAGLTIASGFIGLLIVFFNQPIWVKLNPVVINLTLLFFFSYSLYKPPSMIERFARLQNPDLPEAAIQYTKTVTQVWCGFFIFNIIISSYTALFSSIETWTIYNGFIAYILMGLLFAVEYAVRIKKMKANS